MNEQQNTKEDPWAVEPPKKDRNKKRKALRVALIVAALGAVTLVGVVLVGGNYIRKTIIREALPGLIVEDPREEACVDQSAAIQEAEAYPDAYRHNVISDDRP